MDRYSKLVFSVIALALSVIAYNGIAPKAANAQLSGCGEHPQAPCHVHIVYNKRGSTYGSTGNYVWSSEGIVTYPDN